MDPDLEGDGEGAGGSVGGGGARGGRVPDGAADPGDEGTHLHNTGNKASNECSTSWHFQPGEGPSRDLLRDCEIFAKLLCEL